MANEVFQTLISIEKWANSADIPAYTRTRIKKELEKAKERYRDFEPGGITNGEQKRVYEALVKKGDDLVKKLKSRKSEMKDPVYSYLRYANAAYFDFKNALAPLSTGIRLFALTSALFIALSPQFLGAAFSLVFLVPIFLGLNALKKRRAVGYTLAMLLLPLAFAVSALWLRFGHRVMVDYQAVLLETVKATGKSPEAARLLITVPPVLSLLLLFAAGYMAYQLTKAKDMLI
ncbi:hypothetical protein [Thermosediminibacter oceani]|uniref:Alpha-glucosidase n=1 Tax=Thermosediminibacter oceani (strain ATCC BAA-1034 / DSM 16646 / JW/IW-1228P) TaxID=555079 RepID=D9RY87_THEOJ|nr:hypothetical protein [Thermosediminibacter oceani]ADL08311.1 conserved hypothetical protein [Thermosediminibacter oceani DSM 16646]